MSANQHVVLSDGRWCIRTDDRDNTNRTFETLIEAIGAAREIAKRHGSVLFIHGRNGEVREKNTVSDTPLRPRG